MLKVLEVTFPVFALVFCGFAGASARLLPEKAVDGINAFVFWFALPAMLFRVVALRPVAELWEPRFVAGYVCASLLVFFLVALSASAGWLGWGKNPPAQGTIWALNATHGNVGYLGIALVAELNKQWLPIVALTIMCDIFVLITLSIVVLEIETRRGKQQQWVGITVITGLVKSPLVMSLLAGLVFSLLQLRLPLVLENFSRLLANAAGPCALFAIGASLGGKKMVVDKIASLLTLVKLIIHPLAAAFYLLLVFRAPATMAAVGIVCAALPAASNTFIIGQRYKLELQSLTTAILIGTFLAVFTVSGVIWLLGLRTD
jgi:malonate transporter and related proteins